MHKYLLFYPDKQLRIKMKFKCNSCQHVFEHEADKNECFCPKCGNISRRTEEIEEEQSAVCSECGTIIPSDSTSCPVCGCPISATQHRHCDECGAEVSDSAQVCPQCGCPISAPISSQTSGIQYVDETGISEVSATDVQSQDSFDTISDNTTEQDKQKKYYYIIGGSVIALAVLGALIWFFTNRSSDADDDGDKHIVVAENLFFRSSPSAITDNNLINRLSYGTELKLLGREGDWAEVEVEGEHGYVGWRYILPDSSFTRLNRAWDTANIREIVDQNRSRLAVLDYINKHSLETGAPYWQIHYANEKGKMPNNVAWPDLKNMCDKYPEFAFIIENDMTHERRMAIYSFNPDTEEPMLIYDQPVEYEGMIQDISIDRRGNIQISFTGNRIGAVEETNYDDYDPGCATLEELQEEANRESETIPEDIQDLIKTSELQIVSEETEDETIMPLVDQSKVYPSAEVAPQFPGGEAAMMRWISEHLKYPLMAQENNIQGRVIVGFTVTKTGKPEDFRIIRGKDQDLDKEALRVVKTLPDFIPGKIKSIPVDVTYTIPITFRLSSM